MRVTDFTRRAIAIRREARDMERAGWRRIYEPCWQIVRGGDRRHIVDARVSVNGYQIWYRLSDEPAKPTTGE